jgi:hypothetical protein
MPAALPAVARHRSRYCAIARFGEASIALWLLLSCSRCLGSQVALGFSLLFVVLA